MDDGMNDLAPAVRSILEASASRSGGDKRVDVDPRDLEAAFTAAEGYITVDAMCAPRIPSG
jgi:indole-3-glycerol phosphate synthase